MSVPPESRARRIETELPAVLIDSGGTEIAVVILDLSADGFRLRCSERLESGERVRIRSGRGEDQLADLRWVEGDEAGGVFVAS